VRSEWIAEPSEPPGVILARIDMVSGKLLGRPVQYAASKCMIAEISAHTLLALDGIPS